MPDTAVGHFYLYIKLCTDTSSGEPCLLFVLCVNAKNLYQKYQQSNIDTYNTKSSIH